MIPETRSGPKSRSWFVNSIRATVLVQHEFLVPLGQWQALMDGISGSAFAHCCKAASPFIWRSILRAPANRLAVHAEKLAEIEGSRNGKPHGAKRQRGAAQGASR